MRNSFMLQNSKKNLGEPRDLTGNSTADVIFPDGLIHTEKPSRNLVNSKQILIVITLFR